MRWIVFDLMSTLDEEDIDDGELKSVFIYAPSSVRQLCFIS
jgi:hypothetical protein